MNTAQGKAFCCSMILDRGGHRPSDLKENLFAPATRWNIYSWCDISQHFVAMFSVVRCRHLSATAFDSTKNDKKKFDSEFDEKRYVVRCLFKMLIHEEVSGESCLSLTRGDQLQTDRFTEGSQIPCGKIINVKRVQIESIHSPKA